MLLRGNLSSIEISRKLAKKYFQKGYNCAQSVMLSASKALGVHVPAGVVESASAFSGGIGRSGCLCGALAGAVMLIGYFSPKNEKEASEFFQIFKEKFQSSCCRVLRSDMDFEDPAVRKHCAKITEETAVLLVKFLSGD